MNKNDYEQKYQSLQKEKKDSQKEFDRISMLRLLTAAAAVIFICISRNIIFLVMTLICIIFFVYLMKRHRKTELKTTSLKAGEKVLRSYSERFSDEWKNGSDDGSRFLSSDFPEGKDLDIFGRASLYQFLCLANTSGGKKRLAQKLSHSTTERESIMESQQSVKEISDKHEFRLRFLSATAGVSDEKCSRALSEVENNNIYKIIPVLNILSWLLPAADIVSVGLFIFDIVPAVSALCAVVLTGVQFILSCVINAHSQDALGGVSRLKKYTGQYTDIIDMVVAESFDSQNLDGLKKTLVECDASKGIKSLSTIADLSEVHSNGIAFLLCNAFFMWDIHCMRIYELWQKKYSHTVRQWNDVISEFEMYICLDVIGQVRQNCVYPEIIRDTDPYVEFGNLRHPLIDPLKAVGNDCTLKNSAIIITGSNMSGKTTFMRSIGISAVLAAAGAAVAADHFWISQLRVMTSMRIEDDVSGGISTFYAELLRIKSMVEYSSTGKPVLLLIDEIFKGTNSKDRITGALAAVSRLTGKNAITVITTHDFELCENTNYKMQIVNYHFTEYYENDLIKFDYKIRNGRCTSTNAAYLLKMAGITD